MVAGPVPEDRLDEALRLLRASSALDEARATLDQYRKRARNLAASSPRARPGTRCWTSATT
ncbi:hypothetical protein GCM10029992_20920 [Glycomyces albus]